jgi:ligand-binding sensor domain-containing protein
VDDGRRPAPEFGQRDRADAGRYLWLGTFGGLVRFDGTSFQLRERADSSGRHIDRVLSLAVGRTARSGSARRTGSSGCTVSDYARMELPDALPDVAIRTLRFDRAGILWLGTLHGGVARRAGGGFRVVTTPEGARSGGTSVIIGTASGAAAVSEGERFVAADSAGGLRRWDEGRVPRGVERLLLHDRSGAHWYASPAGVVQVGRGTTRRFGAGDGVPGASVAVEDPERGIWFGTLNDGLVHLVADGDGASGRHYALPGGAGKYRVLSAFVAADGSVWFGTSADGLLRAQRPLFTTYTQAHGLSHSVATAVLEDAAGTLWLATNCWGVNTIDTSGTIRLHKPRRPNDPRGDPCVFSLAESPPGTMWIGTYGGGVTRWQDGREERLRGTAGLRDSVVLALFADRDSTVWAGTNSGGLSALRDGKAMRTYTTADGLAHNSVRVIQQTRDGALWVGTLGGLTRLAGGRLRSFTAADGLESAHVRAVHEDRDGILWVGTYGGGLHRLRDSTFVPVTRRHGLADDVVSSIIEDDDGQFWMSGNRGVQRVARSALLDVTEGRATHVHAVLYDESDGLRNAETNGGFQPAAWRDRRGRLWYPTVAGVARVDPTRVRRKTSAPTVTIEAVVVDGEVHGPAGPLRTGPGRPNIEFQYAGLSISAPEHVRYRYRLEGFEEAWVEAGTRRVA